MKTFSLMTLAARPHQKLLVWSFLIWVMLSGCLKDRLQVVSVSGKTMGTQYHLKYLPHENSPSAAEVQQLVDVLLGEIEAKMSTYKPDSELSQFNRSRSTKPFVVSPETVSVVSEAILIGHASGGALDITVLPLVELWGFGAKERVDEPPAKGKIQAALADLGLNQLSVDPKNLTIKKAKKNLSVDLSAIAKGYAVDQVSELLQVLGLTNHLVEIGGELRTAGTKTEGEPWSVGIEEPDGPPGTVQRILPLSGYAMATSGDYRNYFEKDGLRYSHTINPQTGVPIQHHLASVSVIATDCMSADGWATALNVLGEEKGFALAERKGLIAYFIYRDQNVFKIKETAAFKTYEQLANSQSE